MRHLKINQETINKPMYVKSNRTGQYIEITPVKLFYCKSGDIFLVSENLDEERLLKDASNEIGGVMAHKEYQYIAIDNGEKYASFYYPGDDIINSRYFVYVPSESKGEMRDAFEKNRIEMEKAKRFNEYISCLELNLEPDVSYDDIHEKEGEVEISFNLAGVMFTAVMIKDDSDIELVSIGGCF